MITKDEFYERLERMEPLTGDDLELMEGLSKSTAFMKFLAHILKTADAKATTLAAADLVSQEGINNAIKVQGQTIGLAMSVELYVDYLIEHKAISTELKETTDNGTE